MKNSRFSEKQIIEILKQSEAKRLKQLAGANSKLKRIVADRALDITMVKDLVGKKR